MAFIPTEYGHSISHSLILCMHVCLIWQQQTSDVLTYQVSGVVVPSAILQKYTNDHCNFPLLKLAMAEVPAFENFGYSGFIREKWLMQWVISRKRHIQYPEIVNATYMVRDVMKMTEMVDKFCAKHYCTCDTWNCHPQDWWGVLIKRSPIPYRDVIHIIYRTY